MFIIQFSMTEEMEKTYSCVLCHFSGNYNSFRQHVLTDKHILRERVGVLMDKTAELEEEINKLKEEKELLNELLRIYGISAGARIEKFESTPKKRKQKVVNQMFSVCSEATP